MGARPNGIGYVSQHILRPDTRITGNIAFGVPSTDVDKAAVERTAKLVKLHVFGVGELLNAYETVVGEHGMRLSGGQRQRIRIACAPHRDPAR